MAVGTLRIETGEVRELAKNLARLHTTVESMDRVDNDDCSFLAHSGAAGALAGALNDWDNRRRDLEAALEFLGAGLRFAAEQYESLEARIVDAIRG